MTHAKQNPLLVALALLLFTPAVALALGAFVGVGQAWADSEGPIEFKVVDVNNVLVTGYSPEYVAAHGKPKSLSIPAQLAARWITIQDGAFMDNGKLESVTIDSGSFIENIPDSCFSNCKNLKTVEFPDSLKSIGEGAFRNCSSLKTIELPASVESIGERAFQSCSGLTTIGLPNELYSMGASAFAGCSSLASCEVPGAIVELPERVFSGCASLTSVTLNPGLKTIGPNAFGNCTALTSCDIPASVTSIGDGAFSYTGITSVELPAGLKQLGEGAFRFSKLEHVNPLPDSLSSIGEYVFSNCRFEYMALPDDFESIPEGMFYACSSLKSVHLPSALKSIGPYAFYACSSLDRVYVPEKVTSIGNCALRLVGPDGKYAARYVYFANPGFNWTGAKVFGEPGEVEYPLMRIIVDSSMKSKCQAEASALKARFFANKEMGSRKLAFDANGASGALATVDVLNGMGYALPICSFTNDGGDFVSWNVNDDKFQPGQVVTLTADSTAKAEWSGWSGGGYTVEFDPGDGSGTMPNMLVQKGKAFTLPVCTFEAPAGSVFQGWDVYVYGNHVSFKEGAQVNPGNVASVPVKALWATQRTITFDAAGGKVSPATMKTNGQGRLTSFPTATRAGYVLDCWSTTDDSGGAVSPGRFFSEDTTLHAIWEKVDGYVVTFDPDGGTITSGSESMKTDASGKLKGAMPSATRPGCGFVGWFTSAGKRMTASDVFTGNTVLYAHWSDRPVTAVKLDKTQASLKVGASLQLAASVLPADAGNKALVWSTTAAKVAGVSASGRVSALAVGKATITARAADGAGALATCTVTVVAASSASGGSSKPGAASSASSASSAASGSSGAKAKAKGLAPDGTAVGVGATGKAANAFLTSYKAEKDPAGSKFSKLRLKASKTAKASITLAWAKVKSAKKYVVYGAKCGKKKLAKLKTLGASKKKLAWKKLGGKKLAKGTYYKAVVVALGANGKVLAASKMVHAATAGGKVGNYKKVTTKAKKGKVSLSKGKSFRLGGKAVAASKKLKVKNHRKPVVLYESTKPKVAKVSKKGVVKGVAAGTCYVYAYTQTGVFARVKVTVKKAMNTSKQTSLQGGIVQLAKIEGGRNVDG